MKKQITKIKDIMKKNLFLLIAFLSVATFAFATGCDKDDNHIPNATIVNALKVKYPQAGRVEWEMKKNYHVAEFWQNGVEMEAWFDNSGKWVMTESDIKFPNLPEAIKNSFNASEYKAWKIEDVDKIEKAGMATVYIIEVEKGELETDLYYAEDGTLVKAVADKDGNSQYFPESVPDAISKAISAKYPNARIIDTDTEKGMIEVDIMDGGKHKEVIFDNSNKWVSTSWEVRKSDVPAMVMNAIKASEYQKYRIDDIDFYETPSGSYYRFELDKEPQDIYLMITPQGQIIKK